MKKIFLFAAIILCAVSASAQKGKQSIIWGIRGGLNFPSVSLENDDQAVKTKSRTSFHVGVIADFPQNSTWSIQTGLYLTEKGYRLGSGKGKTECKPIYLEIPVLASYRYNIKNSLQLQLSAGPYLAYGVGGNISADDEDISVFGENSNMKRFDLGPHLAAGLLFSKKYYVGIAYEMSLINNIDDDDLTYKNKNIMFSIGYNF